jgi:spermidine synthase
VHEVAWARALGQVIGGSLASQTIVLGTFLFGLGWGAFLAARFGRRIRGSGLSLYALLEVMVAAWGFAAPLLARAGATVLAQAGPSLPDGAPLIGLRLVVAAALLLPGTLLMGATFPVLVRAVGDRDRIYGTALLYGANTIGAAIGALSGAFALLPLLGTRHTFFTAAALNAVAAAGAWLLRASVIRPASDTPAFPDAEIVRPSGAFLPLAGLSGVIGAMLQFGWTRAMALSFGSSVYALGLTLAATLLGLGLGPLLVARLVRDPRTRGFDARVPSDDAAPRRTAGWAAWALGVTALLVLPLLGRLPAIGLRLGAVFERSPLTALALQFGIAAGLVCIPAMAQGASLPLLVRLASEGDSAAAAAGRVYAASSWGSMAGFALAGFALVPVLGTRRTLALAAALALVMAVWLWPAPRRTRAAIAAAPLVFLLLPGWDPGLMSSGAFLYGDLYRAVIEGRDAGGVGLREVIARRGEVLFQREDGDGVTTVRRAPQGTLSLQINGKTEASTGGDMPTQLLAGHLPMVLHPQARDVLVVGLASGVTLGAVERYPASRITVVEIARGVPAAARRFAAANEGALDDRRVTLVIDDARGWLLARDRRFDVIASQPSNPWVAGVANLFTTEFYRLGRDHLGADGVFAQWVQAYRIAPDDLRRVVRSFLEVFPDATLWEESAGGGDYFLLGGTGARGLDPGCLDQAPEAARDSLKQAGIDGSADLMARYVSGPRSLRRFADGVPAHTDDDLALEWRAPLSLFRTAALRPADLLAPYREPVVGALADVPAARDPQFLAALGERLRRRTLRLQAATGLREADLLALREPALAAGLEQLRAGRPAEAVPALVRAAAASPESPNTHLVLGDAYRAAGLLAAAEVAYRRALELDPNLAPAWSGLGSCRLAADDADGARTALEAAVRLAPEDAIARSNLGTASLRLGDLSAAEMAFREAARLAPDLAAAHANLGVVERRQGRLEAAERDLREALKLDPLDLDARYDLATVLRARGRESEARRELEGILAIDPTDADALTALGRARPEERTP